MKKNLIYTPAFPRGSLCAFMRKDRNMDSYKEIMKSDINRWGKKNIHNANSINFVLAKRRCEKWSGRILYYLFLLVYKRLEIKFGCDIPVKVRIS